MDPKMNTRLAKVFDEAKAFNVPNSTMIEALKRLVSRAYSVSYCHILAQLICPPEKCSCPRLSTGMFLHILIFFIYGL